MAAVCRNLGRPSWLSLPPLVGLIDMLVTAIRYRIRDLFTPASTYTRVIVPRCAVSGRPGPATYWMLVAVTGISPGWHIKPAPVSWP